MYDNEHVVDANAEEEKGQNVMKRSERELESRADAVGDHDAHHDSCDAADGEVDALLHAVHLAKHQHDVSENDQET